MRMARDRGLVIAGSQNTSDVNGEERLPRNEESELSDHERMVTQDNIGKDDDSQRNNGAAGLNVLIENNVRSKRRMSKAERRRVKKNAQEQPAAPSLRNKCDKPAKKVKRGADFRDPAFFIDNDFTSNCEEARRSRLVEAAMQPSTARGSTGTALRLEETMLDIVGDEKSELVQKQRMMRWDKSKRKYVQTTVGQELSGDSKSKKLRLESGQLVKNDKLKLGELYQKWQKKSNRSIGRTGVFDDIDDGKEEKLSGKKKKRGNKASKKDKDEIKTSADIRKEREKKQNMKVKNMKRSERRHFEQKQRSSRKDLGQGGKGKLGNKKR
jgi:hypothetical protein